MIKKTGIILFLFLFFFYIQPLKAAKTSSGTAPADKEIAKGYIQSFSDRYVVSPGDAVNVSVFGEPDLTQKEILVKSDGYINVQPIGEVKIAGFNIDEVKDILTAQLKKYFVDPIVSVQLSNTHIPNIYVYGAVQKPGLCQYYKAGENNIFRNSTPPTLADVITNAGGIAYNADIEKVQVINRRTRKKRTYNLFKLIKNGDLTQDIYLTSEDTVFIPTLKTNAQLSDRDFLLISRSSIAPDGFPVRVRGAVRNPGVHYLTAKSPGINTALASSQGFTIDAKTNAVKIQRVTPHGNLSTIIVDPSKNDIVLRPNDIIDVYDTRRGFKGKTASFFNTLFHSAGGFGSAYNQVRYIFDQTTDTNVYMK